MYRNRLFAGLAVAVGCGVVTAPHAAAATAPHEKTYSAGGIEYTVGHRDFAARTIAPLNGMPTNREAFLDNTTYGRFTGPGSATLETGFLVACQLDLDTDLTLEADLDVDAGVDASAEVSTDGLDPSVKLKTSPEVSAGAGFDFELGPGEIAEIDDGDMKLTSGKTGSYYSRDVHITANNCGGQLTVRGYSIIRVESEETGASGAVYTDPITL